MEIQQEQERLKSRIAFRHHKNEGSVNFSDYVAYKKSMNMNTYSVHQFCV